MAYVFSKAQWMYIKGEENVIADGMSRIVGIDKENETYIEHLECLTYLYEELDRSGFRSYDVTGNEIYPGQETLERENDDDSFGRNDIWSNPGRDEEGDITTLLANLTENTNTVLSVLQTQEIEKGNYLTSVIRQTHNYLVGHHGINRTCQAVKVALKVHADLGIDKDDMRIIYKDAYSQTEIKGRVTEYIKKCAICQKISAHGIELLKTTPWTGSTYAPGECIQMDHIGPFPLDERGNTHILVIIDTCTRWLELYPVKDVGAETTAFYVADYILRYGPPKTVLSDYGSAFIAQTFIDLCTYIGTQIKKPQAAGDKEAVGIVERANKSIRGHLTNIFKEKAMSKTWSFATLIVQQIMNNSVHTTTGLAPAKIMYGKLIAPPTSIWPDRNDWKQGKAMSSWVTEKNMQQEMILRALRTHLKVHDNENKLKRAQGEENPTLEQNTFVLYRRMSKTKQQLEWTGPFMVTDSDRDFYEITSLKKDKVPFMVHARQLKRYHTDESPEDLIDIALQDDEEYIIEKVVDERSQENVKKEEVIFGVLYKDYPEDIHWMSYKEIKNTEAFTKYCIVKEKFTWIGEHAKVIFKEMIDVALQELQIDKLQKQQVEAESKEKERKRKAQLAVEVEKKKQDKILLQRQEKLEKQIQINDLKRQLQKLKKGRKRPAESQTTDKTEADEKKTNTRKRSKPSRYKDSLEDEEELV